MFILSICAPSTLSIDMPVILVCLIEISLIVIFLNAPLLSIPNFIALQRLFIRQSAM